MYRLLCRFLPTILVDLGYGLWYSLLLLLVLYLLDHPAADFFYLHGQ